MTPRERQTYEELERTLSRVVDSDLRDAAARASEGERLWVLFPEAEAGRAEICEALALIPKVCEWNCVRLNLAPLGSTYVHHDDMARALIRWAIDHGAEDAVARFRTWATQDYNEVLSFYILGGVELDEAIALDGRITAVAFAEFLETHQRSHYADVLTGLGHPIVARPSAVLIRVADARPKILEPEPGEQRASRYDFAEDGLLNDIRLLLGATVSSYVGVLGKWATPDTSHPVGSFLSSGGLHMPHDVGFVVRHQKLKPGVGERFPRRVAQFKTLSANDQATVRVALSRLNASRGHRDPVNRATDLGTALEAILLSDNRTEQLSLSFRMRGAWFLAAEASSRRETYERLKTLYEIRSKAVHTGRLDETCSFGGRRGVPIHEALTWGQEACEQAIFSVLERGGLPDWQALVLGLDSGEFESEKS